VNFPRPRSPWFSVGYTDSAGVDQQRNIEAQGLVTPRSNLADFLYGMHYLQFPGAPEWLYTLAGLASGVLLLVLVSGVLIHLRDIVRHFHQFRPHKRLQVLWSDSHKVLGTIGLPFAAVYAFTGAWMGLDSALSWRLLEAGFHGDKAALELATQGIRPEPKLEPSKVPASRLPLAELLARAEAARPLPDPSSLTRPDCRSVYLNEVGDSNATARFYCGENDVLLRQTDGFHIVTPVATTPTLSSRISEVPYAMHFVEFGHVPLRALYVLLGISGCLAILTGNWLWLERRTPSRATRVVQRLTLLIGAGSLLATALMFVANRIGISEGFERKAFWWSWLAVAVLCLVRSSAERLWQGLVALSGACFAAAALPGIVGDWVTSPSAPPPTARVVDAVLLAAGLMLVALARGLRRAGSKTTAPIVMAHAEAADVR
jgi:PepSY-associated TM region